VEFCIVESRRIVAYRQAISCLVALSGDVRWNSVPSCPVALSCADDEVMSSRIVKSCAVLSHCQILSHNVSSQCQVMSGEIKFRAVMFRRIVSYCSVFVWSCRSVLCRGVMSHCPVIYRHVLPCTVALSGDVRWSRVPCRSVVSHC
jgi:hypothetical protein